MEEDDDSDDSGRLFIDCDRIYAEPEKRRTKRQTAEACEDTQQKSTDQSNEQRTENKAPLINYAALMNKEHLKNIPFDLLSNPNNVTDDCSYDFIDLSGDDENIKNKENRTCNDIALIPNENFNENREDSALYACLIENNTSNLTMNKISSVNNESIPNSFKIEDNKTSIYNATLVDLLNKPAQNPDPYKTVPSAYGRSEGSTGLGMNSIVIENSRTEPETSLTAGTLFSSGNITTSTQDVSSLEYNRRVVSVIVPISASRAVCRTEASGHIQDSSTNNCMPTVINRNSYLTATVNNQQNQEINPSGSRLDPHSVGPPAEAYRRPNVLNAYNQGHHHMGPRAPIYACNLGPRCPIIATRPRPLLPNLPAIPSNKYHWASQIIASMNHAQAEIPRMPMSNSHTMRAGNGYDPAYHNMGSMPPDHQYKGLDLNNSAAQHLGAMSNLTYLHTISTQARQNLINMNPKPTTQPKRKATQKRIQASSEIAAVNLLAVNGDNMPNWKALEMEDTMSKWRAKSTKIKKPRGRPRKVRTQIPLSREDNVQSLKTNMAIETKLPNNLNPAHKHFWAPSRTDANLLPIGMNMDIERAQANMKSTAHYMNNITNETYTLPRSNDMRINKETSPASLAAHNINNITNTKTSPAYTMAYAPHAVLNKDTDFQALRMHTGMGSEQVDFRTQHLRNSTYYQQSHYIAESNLLTTTMNTNLDTVHVDVRNAEFTRNVSCTTKILQTPFNSDHKFQTALDMTMKKAQTCLKSTNDTNDLTLAPRNPTEETKLAMTKMSNMETAEADILNRVQSLLSVQTYLQAKSDIDIKPEYPDIHTDCNLNLTEANLTKESINIIKAQADEPVQEDLRTEARHANNNINNLVTLNTENLLKPGINNLCMETSQGDIDSNNTNNLIPSPLNTAADSLQTEIDVKVEPLQHKLQEVIKSPIHNLIKSMNITEPPMDNKSYLESTEMDSQEKIPISDNNRVDTNDIITMNTINRSNNADTTEENIRTKTNTKILKTVEPIAMNVSNDNTQSNLTVNTTSQQMKVDTNKDVSIEALMITQPETQNIKTEIPSSFNTPADLLLTGGNPKTMNTNINIIRADITSTELEMSKAINNLQSPLNIDYSQRELIDKKMKRTQSDLSSTNYEFPLEPLNSTKETNSPVTPMSSMETAETHIKTINCNNNNTLNRVQASSTDQTHIEAKTDIDIKTEKPDINTDYNQNMTEANLIGPKMNINIKKAQSDKSSENDNMSNNSSSAIEMKLGSGSDLQSTNSNMKTESPEVNLRTAGRIISKNNDLQTTLHTTHLQSSEMKISTNIEQVQVDLRIEADNVSSKANNIQPRMNQASSSDQKHFEAKPDIDIKTEKPDIHTDYNQNMTETNSIGPKMNINIKKAQSDKSSENDNMSNNSSSTIEMKLSSGSNLQSTKRNMKTESPEVNLRTARRNMSKNNNDLQTILHTASENQSSEMKISTNIELGQVDLRTEADNVSSKTNNRQPRMNSEHHLLSINNNLNMEISQRDIDANDIKTVIPGPSYTTADLIPVEIDVEVEPAQEIIKTPIHQVNNNINRIDAQMDDETYLGSSEIDSLKTTPKSDKNRVDTNISMPINGINTTKITGTILQNIKTKTNIKKSGDINAVAHDMCDSANIMKIPLSVTPHLQPKTMNMSNDKTQSDLKINATTQVVKMDINKEGAIEAPTMNSDELQNTSNPTINQVNMNIQSSEIQDTNDTNLHKIPMDVNARMKQNTATINETTLATFNSSTESVQTHILQNSRISAQSRSSSCNVNFFSTSTTTEAISHNAVSNELTTLSNSLNDEAIHSGIQQSNTTFKSINKSVETKVTIEIINRISIQTDVLRAIIDNVQRNSEVPDGRKDVIINKTADNKASVGHNCCNLIDVNNKDNREKLEAARKRLARLSELQNEHKDSRYHHCGIEKEQRATNSNFNIKISPGANEEYIPQIIPLHTNSFVEQADYNINNSEDSGQINTANPRENWIKCITDNIHITEDSNNDYYDSQKPLTVARMRSFDKDPEIDEGTRENEGNEKLCQKDEDNNQESDDNLNTHPTLNSNKAHIEQAIAEILATVLNNQKDKTKNDTNKSNNLEKEVKINETLFFRFQIEYFTRMEKQLNDINRQKLANKLYENMLKMIAIRKDKGAEDNIEYTCIRCYQKVICSARKLYYKVDRQYLKNIKKSKKNCSTCKVFMRRYMKALKKYIKIRNGNTDTVNNEITRNLVTVSNLSFNNINEYQCVDTDPDPLPWNHERDTAIKQILDVDPIEEQLSIITSGVPLNPAILDVHEKQNTMNNLDVNGETLTDHITNNAVLQLPNINEQICDTHINSKNIESIEDQLAALTGSTLDVTSNNYSVNDNNEGDDYEVNNKAIKNTEPIFSESESNFNNTNKARVVDIWDAIGANTATTIMCEQGNSKINTTINHNRDKQKKGERELRVSTCIESNLRNSKITAATNDNANINSPKRHRETMKVNSNQGAIGTNASQINIDTTSNSKNVTENNRDARHEIRKDITHGSTTVNNNYPNQKNKKTDNGVEKGVKTASSNIRPAPNNDSFSSKKRHCELSTSTKTERSSNSEQQNENINIATNKDNVQEKIRDKRNLMSTETAATTMFEPHDRDRNTMANSDYVDKINRDERHKIMNTKSTDTSKTKETTSTNNNNTNQKKEHRVANYISSKTAPANNDRFNTEKKQHKLSKSISTEAVRSPMVEPQTESICIKRSHKDKNREKRKRASIETAATTSADLPNSSIYTHIKTNRENVNINNNDGQHTKRENIHARTTIARPNEETHNTNINTLNMNTKQMEGNSQEANKIVSIKTIHSRNTNPNTEINNSNEMEKGRHRELRPSISNETSARRAVESVNEHNSIATNKPSEKETTREQRKNMRIETAATTNMEPHKINNHTASIDRNSSNSNSESNSERKRSIISGTSTRKLAEENTSANNNNEKKIEKDMCGGLRKSISAETANHTILEQSCNNDNIAKNKEKTRENRKMMSVKTAITANAKQDDRNMIIRFDNNNGYKSLSENQQEIRKSISAETANCNTTDLIITATNRNKHGLRSSDETATSIIAEQPNIKTNTTKEDNAKEKNNEKRKRLSNESNITPSCKNIGSKHKKHEKKKGISVESATTTNGKNITTTCNDNAGNKNNSESYPEISQTIAAENVNDENTEVGRNIITIENINNDKRENNERDRGIEKISRTKTTGDKSSESKFAAKHDNINDKERPKQAKKSCSTETESRRIEEPGNKTVNVTKNTQKKEKELEKTKRISIQIASPSNLEPHNRNDCETHGKKRTISSVENSNNEHAEARKAKYHKNNQKDKVSDHKLEKVKTASSTISGSNTVADHDNIIEKQRRLSSATEIVSNTNKASENRNLKIAKNTDRIEKRRQKRKRMRIESESSTDEENNKASQCEKRKRITADNINNENAEICTANNDKDYQKNKEMDPEKVTRKNSEAAHHSKKRHGQERKSISVITAGNNIEERLNNKINDEKNTDNANEKKREKRKRNSIELKTTANEEPRHTNINTASINAVEENNEGRREKRKRITAENTEERRNINKAAKNYKDKNRMSKDIVWTLSAMESNKCGIAKLRLRAQTTSQVHQEVNTNTESDTMTTGEIVDDEVTKKNYNKNKQHLIEKTVNTETCILSNVEEGNKNIKRKRNEDHNKDRDRAIRRSISNEGRYKVSASNKKNKTDKSREVTSTGIPPNVNKKAITSHDIRKSFPSRTRTASDKHKETETNTKTNEEQVSEDSDSVETDEDSESDEDNETSGDKANQVNAALDNDFKVLKNSIIDEDLPAVILAGKSKKKETKIKIRKSDPPSLYKCSVCTSLYVYRRSLFNHATQHHQAQNTELIEYRKCAYCGEYLLLRKYTSHVRQSHPEKFMKKLTQNNE